MSVFNYPARKAVYVSALQKNGQYAQLDIAVEEMSELTKEICKFKRYGDNRDEIAEEVADVMIMLEQLRFMFGIKDDEIENYMDFKIGRLSDELAKKRP